MKLSLQDSSIRQIEITNQASAIMEIDSGNYYNQLSGRNMIAYFENNELIKADVKGNAWTIFYPESEKRVNDSIVELRREGLNRLFAERLLVELQKGEVRQITYFDQPDGIFYPMDQIDPKEQRIKGFQWNPLLRPTNALELRKD